VEEGGGAGEEAEDFALDEDGEDGGVEVLEGSGDAGGCGCGAEGERGEDGGLPVSDESAPNNVESIQIRLKNGQINPAREAW